MAEALPKFDAPVDDLKCSYDKQKVIAALLQLSLKDVPLEELLQRALDLLNTIDWIAVESKGSIFLVEGKPEVLVLKAHRGLEDPRREICRLIPQGRCLCGLAASTRQIQFADGLDARHELSGAGLPPHGHYCVPILFGERLLGVINLYVSPGHRPSPPEEEFLAAVANTLSSIIICRETRAAQQRSQEEFQLLVKNLPATVFKGYLDGSIDLFNDKVEEMTGYPKKDFESRALKWTDLILEEDRADAKQEFVAALKSRQPYLREYRIRRLDGELLWIQERGYIVYDAKGQGIYVSGVFSDISERKQGEIALEQSQARFQALVESVHDGIISADCRGKIVSWNKGAQTMFGYRAAEVVGRSITLLMPERYRAAHQAGLKRVHSIADVGHVHRTQELYGLRKDGQEFPLEISLSAGKVPEGIFFTAIIRDITDRQRVQAALTKTVEKLKKTVQATVRALTSALEMRDPYTVGHQRRVTDLACAIAKELGFSTEKIEGMRIIGFLHDIGKMAVPAEILTKPGKLGEHEFNIIKTHAEAGYNILKEIDFPCAVAKVVAQHHERLNGSGYPKGLHGSEIMLEARILAVADVVEAMSSHRPYRPGLGTEAALQEITDKRGILYDPEVVDVCVKLFTEKGFAFE